MSNRVIDLRQYKLKKRFQTIKVVSIVMVVSCVFFIGFYMGTKYLYENNYPTHSKYSFDDILIDDFENAF